MIFYALYQKTALLIKNKIKLRNKNTISLHKQHRHQS